MILDVGVGAGGLFGGWMGWLVLEVFVVAGWEWMVGCVWGVCVVAGWVRMGVCFGGLVVG